ncbi:MAG: endopeptidase La [Pseudomonadota bacterium]|nr:endopeptidase La [Pseudomonadota bacterium]
MPDSQSPQGELSESQTDGEARTALPVPVSTLPATLYLLPMSDRPFFPAQSLPLLLNERPWLETIDRIGETEHKMVGLVLVKPDRPEDAGQRDFHAVGTVVRMHRPMSTDGKMQFIAEGVARFRILDWISIKPPYLVKVEYPADGRNQNQDALRAYAMAIINTIKDLVPLNPLYTEEVKFFLNRFSPNEPSALADFAASLTTSSKDDLQQVLGAFNLRRRMEKVLVLIKKELDVAKLQSHIRRQVTDKIESQQREFFLREQLKAIQKELGIAKDDRTADIERFRDRVDKFKLKPPVEKRIEDELQKLSLLETGSPEYAVTRNYLDWLTQLPWGRHSKDKLDLKRARKILEKDHYGLDDVKDRIIEFLAVGAMKGEIAGSILLLVGPPGVGKTSIGRSIASALGREFYRFSLGGMRDEAEIKGHRRTYIGAMPGKFIQAITEAGVANPVIMLDEIDKIGASYHGDPASSLLEVLDPEQNIDFLDHYLDVRFDLSKVLFVCTANQFDTIPGALLDRMEIIRLSGYITTEKVQIAKRYLWPKQLEKAGIARERLVIGETALRHIAEGYARESGVRSLEKQLGRLVRKAAVKFINGEPGPLTISVKAVEEWLGKPVFGRQKPLSGVGVVTGLAWTAMGGVILSIEATRVHTKSRGFKLTGQLGSVMKESAEIAFSHVSSHVKEFNGNPAFFDNALVHLHVPEGATPKDGPSAGITMATALLSLARDQKPARQLAMTGELTLTGQVLGVGGIREKVISARRSKVMELILPAANQRDYDKLPAYVREGFVIHFVKTFREVVQHVFG